MKVNVTGRGFINGVGILPARGIELSETEIARLLNFRGVRVFKADTGLQITRATLENLKKPVEKKPALKIDVPAIPKATEPVVVVKKEEVPVEVVPEPPKFETTVTPYITEPVVEEAPAAEESVVEETAVDEAPVEEETVETVEEVTEATEEEVAEETTEETETTETSEEDNKPYYGKKNKKRNRK